MSVIDLRSDTVTKPSPAMREAMARAEVGDDGYGDDPTVNALQARAAEITGKEDALFVPSGTMGNLVSILSHTRPGDSVIIGENAHTWMYESGNPGAVAGVLTVTVGRGGTFTWTEAQPMVRPRGVAFIPPTTLIMLENTHNCGGGVIFPQTDVEGICAGARSAGVAVHLDGARIFNAAVALGRPVKELVAGVDSVTFCLSKGLGCPVGSVVCGSKEFVGRARRYRKMVGGGMRQAGILAAAGLYALEHHVERLVEDHANARLLGEKLSDIDGLTVDLTRVQTNMVFCEVTKPGMNALTVMSRLREAGVWVNALSPTSIRSVCHLGVTRDDVLVAAEKFAAVIR